ncbi:methyl-accepting chemotaxis protein [uncultured Methanolobus sp.]|uniref:HAMP domain-containing methyl-accepting chemotaxis protein n=1 Tax=uncultured Methanolobus sp. TaxID=218300 RepID=UPI0029C81F50|nr:methyl-accepting chemotaxis protein [uncultured Methanolobus sp.]
MFEDIIKKLENIKIKNLLLGSFAVLLILTAIVGYSGYNGMQKVDDRVIKADDMNRLVKYMKDARFDEANYQLTMDDVYATQVNTVVDDIVAQTETSKASFKDAANDQQMDDVQKAALTYNTAFNRYVELEGQKEEAEADMVQQGLVLEELINEVLISQNGDYTQALEQNANNVVLEEEFENVEYANRLSQFLLQARGERLRFMLHVDQQYADNVNGIMDEIITISETLDSRFQNQADKENVQTIVAVTNAYKSDFNSYVSYAEQQVVASEEMHEAASDVQVITEEARADQKEKMDQEMSSSILTMIIMVVIAIIAGSAMALFISKMISKPVNEMLDAANKVAAGDLTVKLGNNSDNELGQLSNALRSMVGNLTGLISEVQAGASRVASTSQEISASSEQMTASSGQISETVTDISQGAQIQSSKAMEVSNAMNDMSISVQEIASNAKNAAQNASMASETIRGIGKESEKLLAQMDEIQGAVSDSAKVIRELDGKSKQIGDIVNLITSIADQTNLLALNAAIEAARAGEHGRGFAVVADEVRKLAEDSSRATKDISVLIHDIQNGSNEAVDVMEKGTGKVSIGAASLRETVEAVRSIVEGSEQIARMAQEIAAAAEEQAASIEEVTASVEEVSSISEQSAAGTEQASASVQEQTASMEELSASAQQLADLANSLMQGAAKFRIE